MTSYQITKRCCKCQKTKPINEFARNKGRSDGYDPRCKECLKLSVRKARAKNSQYYLDYAKRKRSENPAYLQQYQREYRRRNPERVKASNAVNYAVSHGAMPRVTECICQKCGKQATEYHHPDYSKPLEVVPMCNSCHRRTHANK